MNARKNPLDLGDFAPKPPTADKQRPEPEMVKVLADQTGFVSRQPGRPAVTVEAPPVSRLRNDRRYRTGRNIQRNIKIDTATATALDEEAAKLSMTFGEVLERGIAAIRKLRELGVSDY